MAFTIDIDTGGTFTDGFFTGDSSVKYAKVLTTPHDLTVCFRKVIEEGARLFGLRTEELLSEADVVRYSTTVGTNAIIQRSGPKLGLIVTRGHESDLYSQASGPHSGSIASSVGGNRTASPSGRGRRNEAEPGEGADAASEGPHPPIWSGTGSSPLPPGEGTLSAFLSREMVVGVNEAVDADGIIRPLEEAEVLRAIETLIDQGARTIVISLENASLNPVHEQAIRRIFEKEYPPHYLGIVPLVLSTDLSRRSDDFRRTTTAIVNAYLHREMVKYLYRADEELRRAWYRRPLLVTHSSGGTARVAKTTALNTYNSGPAAGMMGCAAIADLYGLPDLICTDMGGTSLDVGLITHGAYDFQLEPEVEGLPVYMPMIEVATIGAGGGSIARVDPASKELSVGPESAGAQPGPAAFDLGGTEPTVTDADILLGFIDPANFLGGQIGLNRDRAERAIRERIASPLGIGVEEAAYRIKRQVDAAIGARIAREIAARGRPAGDFALLAYGGAGPTHCCGYAAALGVSKIITFPHSAVFSAFGSSTADVVHYYSAALPTGGARRRLAHRSGRGQALASLQETDLDEINGIVDKLIATAAADMRGEGFAADQIAYRLAIVAQSQRSTGARSSTLVYTPALHLRGEADLRAIRDRLVQQDESGAEIIFDTLTLRASGAVPHWQMPEFELVDADPSAALKGERKAYWSDGSGEGFRDTPVYEHRALLPGNVVAGPAIVESDSTTYVLPAGARMAIDRYGNGIIEIA